MSGAGEPVAAEVSVRRVRWRQRLYDLGWSLYGLGTVTIGGFMWLDATFDLGRPAPPWLSIPVALAALGAYLWPALLAAGLFVGRERKLGKATVTRGAGGLLMAKTDDELLTFSPAEIAQGAVVDRALVLDDASGRRISIETPEAVRLLDALDLEPQMRRFRFAWRRTSPRVWSFLGTLFATSCLASMPLVLTSRSTEPSLAFLGCMLVSSPWLVAELVSRWYANRELEVGLDGVSAKSRLGKTLVRFADVASVESDADGLVFVTKDGKRTKVLCDPQEPGLRRAIEDRIREAHAIAQKGAGGGGSAAAALLERAGRSLPEWREAAARVLTAAAGFRDAVASPEDIAAVVDDATAPAEQRLAAAIALGGHGDPAAKAKIRVAAEASVSPKLRVALEGLAEGTATDAMLEEAMSENVAAAKAAKA